jgi:glycosyltransferase involved in cell wall biosynthesis
MVDRACGAFESVTFAIPLRRPASVENRRRLDEMLSMTLRSIFQQTRGDFRVLVGTAYRPALPSFVDSRLELVNIPGFHPESWKDAVREVGSRQHQLARHFARRGGGYLMFVDHDDFVSRHLVEYVCGENHPHGYAVADGLIFDAAADAISPFPVKGLVSGPFHHFCGSSIVFRLTPQDVLGQGNGEGSLFSRAYNEKGHHEAVERMAAEGRPLQSFPFPAVTYVWNRGDNLSRGDRSADNPGLLHWIRELNAAILANQISPDAEVRADFAIPEHYPCVEAPRPGPPVQAGCSLSVLLCTYRRPQGLRRALLSIVPQIGDGSLREIIVVNDGTHDVQYEEIVQEFAPHIRYQALEKNVGVAAARNEAARLARGDYLIFTDDDCEAPAFWLDWIAAKLAAHPELDCVAGTTKPLLPAKPGFFARVRATHGFIPAASLAEGMIIFSTANVAIRRSVFEELGGFGFPDFVGAGEDTELAARLAIRGTAGSYDPSWYTNHEVTEGFWGLRRRYRRYGFANGRLIRLNTSPAGHDFKQNRWDTDWWTLWRQEIADELQTADAEHDGKAVAWISAALAASVRMAYWQGVRDAFKSGPQRRSA